MSKLGYIKNSYGESFSVSIANTYSFNVLYNSNTSLPHNSIIVSSNVDDNNEDTGTYSLIITDNYGSPVRLTYTIEEGNGLYYSVEDDHLSLNIDNDTIIYNKETGLSINLENHIPSIFSIENDDRIYINEDKLPVSSKNTLGITYIDEKTILSDDGNIYVNTSNLIYANNSTNEYGIVIGDGETIFIDNGKINLNVNSLSLASNSTFGLSKGDEHTIHSTDGVLSVITENLEKATNDKYGIAKIDGKKIILDSDYKITVNENDLDIATSDKYGVAIIDGKTLNINDNDILSIKEYDNILDSINKYNNIYNQYKKKLEDYIEYLSEGNVLLKNKNILLFAVNETSTVELDKPSDNEEVINMPLQTVSAVFDIITTCDFILNIDFEEGTNEFPTVDVLDVNYNDEITYSKTEALDPNTIYKSTKGELKKFIVRFSAKNFKNTVRHDYVVTSIKLTISSSEDHNKYLDQKYSIVRYNSIPHEEEYEIVEEFYVLVADSVYWDFSYIEE